MYCSPFNKLIFFFSVKKIFLRIQVLSLVSSPQNFHLMASLQQLFALAKPYRFYIFAVFSVGALALYFAKGKGPFEKKNSSHPDFAKYIAAHTSGRISRAGTIRIELVSALHNSLVVAKLPDQDLLGLDPDIEGELRWLDSKTIEFKPKEWLPGGTEFKASFKLGELLKVPDELETFVFTFQTFNQVFEINEPMMEAVDPQSLIYQKMTGELTAADVEKPEFIEKLFTASHEGKNIHVKWEHSSDQHTHRFILDSLIRERKETTVLIEMDGQAAGAEQKLRREIKMPALGDFKVMAALVESGENQYVSIRFSDPLLPGQNLDGLIRMNVSSGNELKFTIVGNEIQAYPQQHLTGTYTLNVEAGILNIMSFKMPEPFQTSLEFEDVMPGVKLLGQGVIIPNSDQLILPFEAVNLSAVDVTIIRIFENNIDQFFQTNKMDDHYQLKRVARPIAFKTMRLDNNKGLDLHKPNRFALDLSTIIKTEPGAIYNVSFSFRPSYSLYRCPGGNVSDGATANETETLESLNEDYDKVDNDEYGEYEDYDYDSEFEWSQKDNPCSKSYFYRERWVNRNVMASNLGIIAKRGNDGEMFVAVADLLSTAAMEDIQLEVYNFQKQIIGRGKTGSDGTVRIKTKQKPYLLIAKKGSQRGYLRLDDGSSLALSQFEVGGEEIQKGLKGLIFGERGVWRPGDSLFTMFLLDDRISPLPTGHPVTFELYTPQGQLFKKIVNNQSLDGFYSFHTATNPEAETGSWLIKVKAGGATFTKNIRIETVQPNRLKIALGFTGKSIRKSETFESSLKSTWLHGSPARNLKAKMEASFVKGITAFPKFKGYIFDDPSRDFSAENEQIFEGNLDENGEANIGHDFEIGEKAPGMIEVNLLTKVFETGGNYSFDRFTIPYHPYNTYIGIKTPQTTGYHQELSTDSTHTISIAAVNPDGKPVSGNTTVKVSLYKLDWRFWWDRTNNDLSSYAENDYRSPVLDSQVELINGMGSWKLRINYPEWGRYLLKVEDQNGGHCTGKVLFLDWPSYYGRAPKEGANEAAFLNVSADKEMYKVGDEVKINIPTGKEGRALISVESGSRVVETFWTDVAQGVTRFSFKATAAMLPNVFVHVSLLQPHAQSNNNLPIRMYGIVPINVEDPNTRLQPKIVTPPSLRPEEVAQIQVSEASGKAMTYTLAVVDEGLLDLTRFKTPDPHSQFYIHEALGVKTWDLYDYVMGAFGVSMDRILAVGGDEGMNRKGGDKKANRFKPMVKFLGPFTLEKGATNNHSVKIPQYIGSARVMVIAAKEGSYGWAEKAVPIKKPLMVLATLPRMLAMQEEVNIPVTVFALESNIRNVKVDIQTNGLFQVVGPASKSVVFTKTGDQVVDFNLRTKNLTGIARVKVVVTSGTEKSSYDVELDVRNPNPFVTELKEGIVAGGTIWNSSFKPPGTMGSNKASLEVSSIPAMNLEKRLDYLIHYPYGCVEQTVSSVFPQLVLNDLVELSQAKTREIDINIKAGINRLKGFQQSEGGFSYWPGGNRIADDWGTSYAGHFMVEAQRKGYSIPSGFLYRWGQYQEEKANAWQKSSGNQDEIMQAYRLFTLALSGDAKLGPMNRLKELKPLMPATQWILAAAYALAGQKETAKALTSGLPLYIPSYYDFGDSYGSDIRDESFILMALSLTGQINPANEMMKKIASKLGTSKYYSTQSTAMALVAISRYMGNAGKEDAMSFSYKFGTGANQSFNRRGKVQIIPIPVSSLNSIPVEVKNNSSKQMLFTRIIARGQPIQGDPSAANSHVQLNIRYLDVKGKEISVSSLEQGTEFMAEVSVMHLGSLPDNFTQMAINQVFPAGWEIRNTRMEGGILPKNSAIPDYQDVRDDRVNTFFGLGYRETKTFYVLLNAAYIGKYFLPSTKVEAMYNGDVFARAGGFKVAVIPGKTPF